MHKAGKEYSVGQHKLIMGIVREMSHKTHHPERFLSTHQADVLEVIDGLNEDDLRKVIETFCAGYIGGRPSFSNARNAAAARLACMDETLTLLGLYDVSTDEAFQHFNHIVRAQRTDFYKLRVSPAVLLAHLKNKKFTHVDLEYDLSNDHYNLVFGNFTDTPRLSITNPNHAPNANAETLEALFNGFPEASELWLKGGFITSSFIEVLRKTQHFKSIWLRDLTFEGSTVRNAFFDLIALEPMRFKFCDKILQQQFDQYIADIQKVKILLIRFNENDLQKKDIIDPEIYNAVLRIGENPPPYFNTDEFRNVLAIASNIHTIITEIDPKINVTTEFGAAAVVWCLQQLPDRFTLCDLQADTFFHPLIQKLTRQDMEKIRFKGLTVSPETLAHLLRLSSKGLNVELVRHEALYVNMNPFYDGINNSCIKFHVKLRNCLKGVAFEDLLAACTEKMEVTFSNSSFFQDVCIIHKNLNVIRFVGQHFTSEDVDHICKIPKDQLKKLELVDVQYDNISTAIKLMEFLHSISKTCLIQDKSNALNKYREEYRCAERVNALIAKYHSNTLTLADIGFVAVRRDVDMVDSMQFLKANIDPEDFKTLQYILKMPININIENISQVKAAKWRCQQGIIESVTYNADDGIYSFSSSSENQKLPNQIVVRGKINNFIHFGAFDQLITFFPKSLGVVFLNGNCYYELNLTHENLNTIDLYKQTITMELVETIRKIPVSQLISFRAFQCEFESSQTRSAFVEAILQQQRLSSLTLNECGVTRLQLALLERHLETNRTLMAISLEGNVFRPDEDKQIRACLRNNGLYNSLINTANNFDFNNPDLFFEKFEELQRQLLVSKLDAKDQQKILQTFLDIASASKTISHDILDYVANFAREQCLDDKAICDRQLKDLTDLMESVSTLTEMDVAIDVMMRINRRIRELSRQGKQWVTPEQVHKKLILLAHNYIKSGTQSTRNENVLLNLLRDIKPSDNTHRDALELNYQIFKQQIRRILQENPDQQLTELQANLLKNLDADTTLPAMLKSIDNFFTTITDSKMTIPHKMKLALCDLYDILQRTARMNAPQRRNSMEFFAGAVAPPLSTEENSDAPTAQVTYPLNAVQPEYSQPPVRAQPDLPDAAPSAPPGSASAPEFG
ncbi:MAG: hypothetical protein M3R00_01125 [Pseudomonadota bacterium]|nr:hypothetical protein [Pseudomonadota bacterium]